MFDGADRLIDFLLWDVQEGAAAGGSGGGGSVLSEVIQPKVDLAFLQTFQPVSSLVRMS